MNPFNIYFLNINISLFLLISLGCTYIEWSKWMWKIFLKKHYIVSYLLYKWRIIFQLFCPIHAGFSVFPALIIFISKNDISYYFMELKNTSCFLFSTCFKIDCMFSTYRVYSLREHFRNEGAVKEQIYSRVILKIIMCHIEMRVLTLVLTSTFMLPGKTDAFTELWVWEPLSPSSTLKTRCLISIMWLSTLNKSPMFSSSSFLRRKCLTLPTFTSSNLKKEDSQGNLNFY